MREPTFSKSSPLNLSVGVLLPLTRDTTRLATSKARCKERKKERKPQGFCSLIKGTWFNLDTFQIVIYEIGTPFYADTNRIEAIQSPEIPIRATSGNLPLQHT